MEFIYKTDKLSYQKIIKKYKKIKIEYKKEKAKLQIKYNYALIDYNYINYEKILYQKNKLDLKYIKKVIKIFKPILKNKVTIFLHGSYARNLNRWNSDIDLNILYKNELKDKFLVVEELIQVLLYKLFDFSGRDKIHNVMIYYPLYNNKKYKIKEDNHNIIWNNNEFKFKCRKNYEKIYPLILNSRRDCKDLYKWILEDETYNEYLYSFLGINKKGKKFTKDMLLDKDKLLLNSKKLKYIEISKLKNINDLKGNIEISEINKILKIHNSKSVNNFLLNLKTLILLNKGKCPYLNIKKILNNKNLKSILSKKEIKEIETNIIKFRLVLDKIENLFLTLNLNFSSRENDKINIEKLNQEYYNLYKTDLYEDLKIIDIINEMISIIKLN